MTPSEPLYRLIPLTQGQWAIVDIADYNWLMQWHWYAKWNRSTRSFYAIRNVRLETGKRTNVSMNREILRLLRGDKRKADHKDHITLNNRRENLRIVSNAENCRNQRVRASSTTGHKGISVNHGKYQANIRANGGIIHLGSFPLTPEGLISASEIYQFAADLYYGDFTFLGTKRADDCEVRRVPVGLQSPRVRANRVGRKGVWVKRGNTYCAGIQVGKKRIHLGHFPLTPEGLEAASGAYEIAAKLYFGGSE